MDLARVLLKHSTDIEAPSDRANTSLDWEITFRSDVMVQAFLEQGTILRDRDADGKRLSERAVKDGHVLKVDVLAKKRQPCLQSKGI